MTISSAVDGMPPTDWGRTTRGSSAVTWPMTSVQCTSAPSMRRRTTTRSPIAGVWLRNLGSLDVMSEGILIHARGPGQTRLGPPVGLDGLLGHALPAPDERVGVD